MNVLTRGLGTVDRIIRDQRRARRFPHFVSITIRPRKDGRAQQLGQSVLRRVRRERVSTPAAAHS